MRRMLFILCVAVIAFMQSATLSYAFDFDLVDLYDVSVSDNDLSTRTLVDYDDFIELLSNYTNYQGVIPAQYMDYLRSCLSWSTLNDHYVAFVSSYTVSSSVRSYYVIAIGDLSLNGNTFVGSAVDVYEFFPSTDSFNRYSNFRHTIQSTFSFTSSGGLVFTDLSSAYPDLRTSSDKYLFTALVILAIVICFYVFTKFGWRNVGHRRVLK